VRNVKSIDWLHLYALIMSMHIINKSTVKKFKMQTFKLNIFLKNVYEVILILENGDLYT